MNSCYKKVYEILLYFILQKLKQKNVFFIIFSRYLLLIIIFVFAFWLLSFITVNFSFKAEKFHS